MTADPARGASGIPERLKASVVAHYEGSLARFGPTAKGMDWKDEASQRLRFRILSEVCDLSGRTVHEIACGAGHLYDFLAERGVAAGYSGSDLSAAMIEAARSRHPDVTFEQRDLLAGPAPARRDIVLCSGLFHVRLDHPEDVWWSFVRETVSRMYAVCGRAIAFNLMSDRVDYRAENLFYAEPSGVLDFCCRELSRYVTLRHDYPLHEFTVYVYRDGER
jgi:SAM-dependent methyltransferase